MVHCQGAFELGASLLLHTTNVRSWYSWCASCVAAYQKKNTYAYICYSPHLIGALPVWIQHQKILVSFGDICVSACPCICGYTLTILISKLFLRCAWLFCWTAVLFRQIRTFSQLFRFGPNPENSGIQQIVRCSMLTGRWREGRILVNLCGRNKRADLRPITTGFLARFRTVLGAAKVFFCRV